METMGFPLEIKELAQSGAIVGLAAAFGNVDSGGDRIMPGAFTKSLGQHAEAGTRPALLLHHDMRRPIGAWQKLSETPVGLLAEGKLTLESRDGKEAYALARDGALTGLSIGYRVDEARPAKGAQELHSLTLFEVSLVSVPMNNRARVATVKSIAGPRDIQDLLREAGLSSRASKRAGLAAWQAIQSSETDDDLDEAKALLTASIERLTRL